MDLNSEGNLISASLFIEAYGLAIGRFFFIIITYEKVSGVPLNIFNSVYRSSCLCVIFFY